MKIVYLVWLAVVLAEPPPPEGFAGYERGGYEIQPGSGNTGESQFPESQGGQQDFGGVPQSAGGQGSNDFSASGAHDSGSNEQSQRGGLDSASGTGFGSFDSPPGPSQGQFGGSDFTSGQSGSFGDSNELRQRGSQRFNSGSGSNDGGNNGNDGGDGDDGGDLDDIPGEPGKDYPIYGEIPKTSFRCQDQASPGYFADVETQCQVFHICQKGGQMDSVLCPNGTIFNQKVFVCSWWYDFDCDLAAGLFALNEQVNAAGENAALSAKQGATGGARGGEGYAENGPNGGNSQDYADSGLNGGDSQGYAENGPNGGQNAGGFSGNGQALAGNALDGSVGGYSGGGSSFDSEVGNAQGQFVSGGQSGEEGLNDVSRNSVDAFSGYSDNGPDFAQSSQQSGQNFPNTQNSRGASRFEQSGRDAVSQGYSDNGPNSGRQSGSNDLATSGDHFGNSGGFGNQESANFGGNRGNGESVESGYPSKMNGNGFGGGQNEGGDAGSSGYSLGREGSGERDFPLPSEGRQSLMDLIGGPSRRGNSVGGNQDVPSSEYLPPKEDGSSGESLEQDRSYLPPGK